MGLWRSVTYRPALPYTERHPLPPGWRPRTRIDMGGWEVEPWLWVVVDQYGESLDGGEKWLPVGRDVDQAAWELLGRWLKSQGFMKPWELPGCRLQARRATIGPDHIGVAFVQEQALRG